MSKVSVPFKIASMAVVLALGLASFATSVFAAGSPPTQPATSSAAITKGLETDWKVELSVLQYENAMFSRIDRKLDNFGVSQKASANDDRGTSESLRSFELFDQMLAKAQQIVSTHAGFDTNGTVTDQAQALKSVQTLGGFLNEIRGVLIRRLDRLAA